MRKIINKKEISFFRDKYAFLSNFYTCMVRYEHINYPTLEHAFQAAKTFDKDIRIKISRLDTAAQAKHIGKKLLLRPDWEKIKQEIMYSLLQIKFRNSKLKSCLLNTGNIKLIEGNWWGDTYWGVYNGKGKNHLGKLLMKLRKELRKK